MSLGIPASPEEQEAAKGRKSARTKQPKTITLQSCFDHFASPEPTHQKFDRCSGSARVPFCSKCGPTAGVTKTLRLSKCPKYLALHLKRFQWDGRGAYKVNTIVELPTGEFDIAPYVAEGMKVGGTKYELYAVVVHEGDR